MGSSLLAKNRTDTKKSRQRSSYNHRRSICKRMEQVGNLRVGGLVFLPRLRPPGVEAGEDIAAGKSTKGDTQ